MTVTTINPALLRWPTAGVITGVISQKCVYFGPYISVNSLTLLKQSNNVTPNALNVVLSVAVFIYVKMALPLRVKFASDAWIAGSRPLEKEMMSASECSPNGSAIG